MTTAHHPMLVAPPLSLPFTKRRIATRRRSGKPHGPLMQVLRSAVLPLLGAGLLHLAQTHQVGTHLTTLHFGLMLTGLSLATAVLTSAWACSWQRRQTTGVHPDQARLLVSVNARAFGSCLGYALATLVLG